MASLAAATLTQVVTHTVTASSSASPASSSLHRAAPQGGIIEGSNPSHYDPKNPIVIFIIQAGIIIIFCRLLQWPLSKLRQPRVIAEVIGGILLGPSVMGRIPGFTNAIFPAASIPNLTLVANLGLVLFLFLVGLEVDLRYLAHNWKVALSVGAAGMALPFGLGCAIAWGLFNSFHDDSSTIPIPFPVYMLFIGVAMAITAFPVLCRILTELKLLSTPVGVIVLSAGVGNDVIGWVLLALCVALTNAGTGLSALWVLLAALGWIIFLVFAVRPTLMWVLRRSGALQDGPSQGIVALTLMVALCSAFFTAIIGIHPIFGAFLAGLICPHEGGFAIKVTEKIEDLVGTLFLPLYFALSGLSTNLGLLDNGKTWGYVIGVVAVAFFGKFIGGSGAARLNGLVWRECFTIGSLMSCKGLVELIVLNIGLQAHILSVRTFTIFVVMALITTFATTPLVAALYPPWYQQKLEQWKRGEIDWDSGERRKSCSDAVTFSGEPSTDARVEGSQIRSVFMHLRLDCMPGLLAFASLCGSSNLARESLSRESENTKRKALQEPIVAHGLRLRPLTERDSSVMRVSELEDLSALDPVVNTFRAYGQLHHVSISGDVVVVPEQSFSETLATRAHETGSDLLLLPWSETGSMSEFQNITQADATHKLASQNYQAFVDETVASAKTNVGVLVNNGLDESAFARRTSSATREHQHRNILLLWTGTSDDKLAFGLALRLAYDKSVRVHVGRTSTASPGSDEFAAQWTPAEKNTARTAVVRDLSKDETLDALIAAAPESVAARVKIDTLDEDAEAVTSWIGSTAAASRDAIFFLGRNGTKETESCLGPVADLVLEKNPRCSLLVMHSLETTLST